MKDGDAPRFKAVALLRQLRAMRDLEYDLAFAAEARINPKKVGMLVQRCQVCDAALHARPAPKLWVGCEGRFSICVRCATLAVEAAVVTLTAERDHPEKNK